jgi:hypothetical protein
MMGDGGHGVADDEDLDVQHIGLSHAGDEEVGLGVDRIQHAVGVIVVQVFLDLIACLLRLDEEVFVDDGAGRWAVRPVLPVSVRRQQQDGRVGSGRIQLGTNTKR